jgi:hypothetical protein
MTKETPRTMKHIAAMAAMVVALLAVSPVRAETGNAQAATPPPTLERPTRFRLVDAAPSIEVLLDRLLDALAKNDAQALHRLRVTEDEYVSFVIPGSAKQGEPPQVFGVEDSRFAWGMLNTKSTYAGAAVLRGFGGHTYKLKGVEYAKGHKQFVWFDAYATTVLTLEDETGEERELTLGSIAHIDGQYKFIGLHGNR